MELQSSDSGADLSEYYLHNSYHSNNRNESESSILGSSSSLKKLPSMKNNDDEDCQERKNYMECETWEKYWTLHGERLIWASWIAKYSDYIDPEFSKKNIDTITELPSHPTAESNLIITIDESSKSLSSCSNDEIVDAKDYLLQPRCISSDSIPNSTIGTTDSMTNVTQMTISSYDLNSSAMSSESSKNSSDALLDSHTNKLWTQNCDDAMDTDQYWQVLWKNHVEELYAKHYALYIAMHTIASGTKNVMSISSTSANEKYNLKAKSKDFKVRRKNINHMSSVGFLLKNLSSTNINETENISDNKQDLDILPTNINDKDSNDDALLDCINEPESNKQKSMNQDILPLNITENKPISNDIRMRLNNVNCAYNHEVSEVPQIR